MTSKNEMSDLRTRNWEQRIWCDRHIGNMSGTWEQTPDVWSDGVDVQEYVRSDIVQRLEQEKAELVEVLEGICNSAVNCIQFNYEMMVKREIIENAEQILKKHKGQK